MGEIFKQVCSDQSSMLWSLLAAFVLGWFVRGALRGRTQPQSAKDAGRGFGSNAPSNFNRASVPDAQLDQAVLIQLQELLKKGNKVAAIKLVREKTGKDLLAAKQFIETLQ